LGKNKKATLARDKGAGFHTDPDQSPLGMEKKSGAAL
jgi:hypothetical protein